MRGVSGRGMWGGDGEVGDGGQRDGDGLVRAGGLFSRRTPPSADTRCAAGGAAGAGDLQVGGRAGRGGRRPPRVSSTPARSSPRAAATRIRAVCRRRPAAAACPTW